MKPYLAISFALILSSMESLACDRPEPVKVPDGATATADEMRAASDVAKEFMRGMEQYVACLEAKHQDDRVNAGAVSLSAAKDREDVASAELNAAAAEMKDLSARFQKAVDDYEAKTGK